MKTLIVNKSLIDFMQSEYDFDPVIYESGERSYDWQIQNIKVTYKANKAILEFVDEDNYKTFIFLLKDDSSPYGRLLNTIDEQDRSYQARIRAFIRNAKAVLKELGESSFI